MKCYICNTKSYDEHHCELCRFEVYPIQEWMSEATGESSWTESNMPFMQLTAEEGLRVSGFIAGGQMPFKVDNVKGDLRLIRIDVPEFTYVPFTENTY